MQSLQLSVKAFVIAACMTMIHPVFAEPAPVYDADAMSQQVDSDEMDQADQQDVLPLAAGDSEATFVPMPGESSGTKQVQAVKPQKTIPQQTGPKLAMVERGPNSMSIEQRMNRVEQQIDNIQENDLAARTDSLQNQLQSLRDEIEQLTHQLQQVQNQQKAAPAHPQQVENKAAPNNTNANPAAKNNQKLPATKTPVNTDDAAVTTVSAQAGDQPNVAEEQQIYQTAYNLIKAKKYNEAVNALQGMLQKYPTGQFASNAHYWLGELYGVMGKNDQALNEFNTVVRSYPDSPRVSDAQLKVGIIYAAQLKWKDAKIALKKVINHYPGTTSARLATEQLKQIRQTGH